MKHFLYAMFILPAALTAQGTSTGLSQLLLPFHARTAAMGGAVVASSQSYSASLVNPAALYTPTSTEILLSHSEWIQDVQSEFVGARLPFEFGTFAAGIANVNVKGIELRQKPGPAEGSFTARFAAFQLSYARALGDAFAVGVTAKYLYEKVFVDEANGYAVDLGALYETPIPHLSIGASWTNNGSMKAFRQVRARLPQQLRIGVTYRRAFDEFDVAPSLDAVSSAAAPLKVSAGVELAYQQMAWFRLGYTFASELRGLSIGAGLRYEFVKFDYAFVPFSLDFGNAHILSLGFEL